MSNKKSSSSTMNSQYMKTMSTLQDIDIAERSDDSMFMSDSMLHESDGSGQRVTLDQRRRCYMQRSNRKKYIEPQVMWTRNNIAATMERFEPAGAASAAAMQQPCSSISISPQLEYGFAAGVVIPTTAAMQTQRALHHHHHPGAHSTPSSPAIGGELGAGAIGTPMNHVYSYAYYEPGIAKCHTNIPLEEEAFANAAAAPLAYPSSASASRTPSRNSIRALLAKGLRCKPPPPSHSGDSQFSSGSPTPTTSGHSQGSDERHTYTTRYGTTENLYEEVNEQKMRKVLSDNRIAPAGANNIKEELRRVQCNHFRVLDQLNLSLEALIMPPSQTDDNKGKEGAQEEEDTAMGTHKRKPASSIASSTFQRRGRGGLLGGSLSSYSTSTQPREMSHDSLENLSATLTSIELKDPIKSSCNNPEFDEGDLDSGFSGSSSSGASCNDSLRYYKTVSGTSKSSMASSEDQCIAVLSGNRQRR